MGPIPEHNQYARYSGLAMQMLVIILAGVFGGLKIDQWIGLRVPVATIILAALSIALSILVAVREIDKTHKK